MDRSIIVDNDICFSSPVVLLCREKPIKAGNPEIQGSINKPPKKIYINLSGFGLADLASGDVHWFIRSVVHGFFHVSSLASQQPFAHFLLHLTMGGPTFSNSLLPCRNAKRAPRVRAPKQVIFNGARADNE